MLSLKLFQNQKLKEKYNELPLHTFYNSFKKRKKKKQENETKTQRYRATRTFLHCWGEFKMGQPLWEIGSFLQSLIRIYHTNQQFHS